MQVTILPKITLDKPSKERIFQLIRVFLYTVGFVGIILHLNEFDNMTFQSLKGRQSNYALLFFMLIVMTMQKVRFINWQSLVTTAVYVPIAFFRVRSVLSSPELVPGTIISQITFWMALMIVTDMLVTGRVRKIREMNLWMTLLLVLMTGMLMISRFSRDWPVLYLYFLLLIFVPIDEEEWGRVYGGLLNAGVLSFALVTLLSFKINPHFMVDAIKSEESFEPGSGGRWYGYFLNIGTFGQFCGLQIVLAFLSIIRSKDKFGRFGLMYAASFIWLAAACFLGFLCGADNLLLGVFVFIIFVLVFGFKKTKFPHLAVRILLAVGLICLLGFFVIDGINRIASVGFDPAKTRTMLNNTPLRLFPAASNTIVNKITAFHNMNNPYTDYITNPVKMFINYIGSSRPAIWEVFAEHTTFKGTESSGLMYRSYFAFNAHNQYVQVLYEQGIVSGGLNILFFILGWLSSVIGYVKTKKEMFFAPTILVPMMLAMWMGEGSSICFALTFISFFAMMPAVMNNIRSMKKAETTDAEEQEKKVVSVAKKGAVAGVVVAAIFVLIAGFLLIRRIRNNNKSYLDNGLIHMQLADAEEEFLLDNGLYSSKDIKDKAVKGSILMDYAKVRKTEQRASWGDRAFLSFNVDNAVENDSLIMEFTAKTTEQEPILLTVSYSGQKTTVEVDKGKSRYFLPFKGEEGERNVLFVYDLPEGGNQSLILDNICLADYGQERLYSSLKTGEYSVTECEEVMVSMDSDKFIRSTSAIASGAYLYSVYAGELTVYRGDNFTEVGKLKGLGDTMDVFLTEDGKNLLVTSRTGISLVDISRPDSPMLLSNYRSLECALGADICGNYAFICNRYFGIEVVDISDKTNPKYVTKIQYPMDAEYRNCHVFNGYLYVSAVGQNRVDIYDVRNISDIHSVSYLDTHGRPMELAAKDNTLFVATSGSSVQKTANGYGNGAGCGMDVFDISNPEYPELVAVERIDGRITSFPYGIWDIAVDGNYAYLSMQSGGLYVYDVSTPSVPKRVDVVNISVDKESDLFKEQDPEKVTLNYNYSKEYRGTITHTAIGSSGVFCVSPDMGLFKAPIALKEQGTPNKGEKPAKGEVPAEEPEATEGYSLQILKPEGDIFALALIEDRQFVAACGMAGLKVMDKQMHTICSLETGSCITDVKVVGNLVYAAESCGGFAIYRYENGLLTEVGKIVDTAWNAYIESLLVSKDGTWVLAQAGYGRYRIIDCSNPENPVFVKSPAEEGTGGMWYRNTVSGIVSDKYYGIAGSSRVLWFTEAGTDVETGAVKLNYVKDENGVAVNEFNGITPLGDACIVFTNKGYRIVHPEKGDVIEPVENPELVFTGKSITDGNRVIISEAHTGKITVVNFADKTNPVVELRLDTPYITDIPCVMDGEIYVPLRHDGILKITKN